MIGKKEIAVKEMTTWCAHGQRDGTVHSTSHRMLGDLGNKSNSQLQKHNFLAEINGQLAPTVSVCHVGIHKLEVTGNHKGFQFYLSLEQDGNSQPQMQNAEDFSQTHCKSFSPSAFFFLILHCEYSEFGSNAFKCLQTFPIYTQIEGCTKADRRNQLCSAMKVAMSDIVLSLAASESKLGKWYLKEYLSSYILTGHVL